MIAVGSIGKLLVSEGSGAYTFFNTFGNTVLALFCGIIAVGMLIFGRKKKVVDKANVDGNGCKVSEKSSWFEIVMNQLGRPCAQHRHQCSAHHSYGWRHGWYPARE